MNPNLEGVKLPTVPERHEEMLTKIRDLAAAGYTKFKTVVTRCLNVVESPSPDRTPEGFEPFGFVPDCKPEEEKDGEYNDFLLYAAKD